MSRPVVLLLGPARTAVSGVSTHVNLLLASTLANAVELVHFQVGSEGRGERALGRLVRLIASPLALLATIVFRRVSIVHLNTSLNRRAYWRDLAYLVIAKLLRARVVYQVHGGALPGEFFAGPLATRWLRWTLALPDRIVVLAQVELDAYRRFVPDQHVVALPNGIDCCRPAGLRVERSRPGQPLRLLYIGRIAREKGLYEALQGMRLAADYGFDSRIIIAGQGEDDTRLRRYAEALGLARKVHFVGAVFGEAKRALLAGADVALLPSYAEGLPYALLEAMGAGVPVVATPVGAIPDVMSHGIHGYLVPPRDGKAIAEALTLLAADRSRLRLMGRACRLRVAAAYSITRVARELAQHYGELCGAPAPARAAQRAAFAPRSAPGRAALPVTERRA